MKILLCVLVLAAMVKTLAWAISTYKDFRDNQPDK
jgi:hypothetical protein